MKVVSDNVALSQKQKAGDFLATARLLATQGFAPGCPSGC